MRYIDLKQKPDILDRIGRLRVGDRLVVTQDALSGVTLYTVYAKHTFGPGTWERVKRRSKDWDFAIQALPVSPTLLFRFVKPKRKGSSGSVSIQQTEDLF